MAKAMMSGESMSLQFCPNLLSRNRHLQSIIATTRVRNNGSNAMLRAAQQMIIDGGAGVRLLGYHSPQTEQPAKALVILIHGWEGSSESAYIQSSGKYLFERGYDVFRLNLRDHGESHHLNEGLFHGALIDETLEAVSNICRFADNMPVYLMGFSLGGNFGLRIALRQSRHRIENLRHVFAISPPLDPYKATRCIDASLPFYRLYFLRKWKRSLRKKQALYPHRYDFNGIMNLRTCLGLTEAVMRWYPEYTDCRDYFKGYTLLNDAFHDLSMPVTVVTAEDDPFIPVDDFRRLERNPHLRLLIQRYGGHCGFLELFPYSCWYDRLLHRTIEKEMAEAR
ncbi:MAG: alpha/beta fold hydrolase [Syntrophales bacterium]|nr:alpha/beta fold hydrolase [Syntrophales bacterium]